MSSENVFNILGLGRQSGTAEDPGAAVAAAILFPVSEQVNFDLDRGSAFPKQDRGRDIRNNSGAGYHGVRSASTTLPWELRYDDLPDILEMLYCGNVTPVDLGGGLYRWDYPFEVDVPTVVPGTFEGGNTDNANSQMRLVSALVSSATFSFANIPGSGASPWQGSAEILAFDREDSEFTPGLSARGAQVIQGKYTRLYTGETSENFSALAELPGTLKSFSFNPMRNRVGRAYGGADDQATNFGQTDQSNTTFEMNLGVNADSKGEFHDVWNVSVPTPIAEKRTRLLCAGHAGRIFLVDCRMAPLAVPFDESDGERLFKVTGEFTDDDGLDASHQISVTNGTSTLD